MKLINKSKILISQQPPLGLVDQGQVLAGDIDRTRCGQIQSAQEIQQGGLAGTGTADDRNLIRGEDLEIDILQYLNFLWTLEIDFPEMLAGQYWLVRINQMLLKISISAADGETSVSNYS